MRSKRQTAWETAAKCEALAKETDGAQEREHYARMREAWITLANRCEFIEFPDVTSRLLISRNNACVLDRKHRLSCERLIGACRRSPSPRVWRAPREPVPKSAGKHIGVSDR